MNEETLKLRDRMQPVADGDYLLGLSGGADSVALLTMLLPDVRSGRLRIEAVHVNHGIRGSEADGDEQFCAEICRREGIPFTAFHADLAGRKDEASARKARYAFFRERLEKTGKEALLTAHHADDQTETILMRLLRGAGPDGLEGMKGDETLEGIRIIRPMLGIRREEIRNALLADGIPWREDSSNRDTAYLRNRVRLELIPLMKQLSTSAAEKVNRTAALLAEDNALLNRRAREIFAGTADGGRLNAETLSAEPPAIQKRVLRLWWQQNSPEMDEHAMNAVHTEALAGLLRTERGRISLPGNMTAVRSGSFLFLEGLKDAERTMPADVSGRETVFGDYRLEVSPSEGDPGDGKRTQEVPSGFLEGCVIRNRQPGDRIRPFGGPGSRKLQDYLTDRKIPEPFRDRIPLLCRGNEVLLVCGVGAGDVPPWSAENHSVRLTWIGDIPWM